MTTDDWMLLTGYLIPLSGLFILACLCIRWILKRIQRNRIREKFNNQMMQEMDDGWTPSQSI